MRVRCTVRPCEAPECLGLRVLRSRGYSGRKQRKVGWSKTMVWPPSAPSQVRLGRGARNQGACVLQKIKCRCRAPELFRAGSDRVGEPKKAVLACGEKKIDWCRPPSAPSWKWPGQGAGVSRYALTGRNGTTALCSKCWSECYRRSLLFFRCLVV